MKRKTSEEFILDAKKIHFELYDYSLVEYVDRITHVKIICKIHGEYLQKPQNHLKGSGCPICAGNIKHTTEKIIEKCEKIHGKKYNYSLIQHENLHNVVKIICPIHGVFEQSMTHHLAGSGCKLCSWQKLKLTKDEFILKSEKINNNKFDYSLVNFNKRCDSVILVCKIHNFKFERTINSILDGIDCPLCGGFIKNIDEYIEKCKIIHNEKYLYNKTKYLNSNENIIVTCLVHGDFEVKAMYHLQGTGCPKCYDSKGVSNICNILNKKNIFFIKEKTFNDCVYKNKLRFDFYLPEQNICIEYDGIQHFRNIDFFGGEKAFNELKIRDSIKNKYCENNNINLIRISYLDNIDEKLNNYFTIDL